MKKYVIEFEAPDDWQPMEEPACWAGCPFSSLTKLGNICNAKEAYDRSGLVICPVIRLAKIKPERGKRADIGIYEDWQGKAVEDEN